MKKEINKNIKILILAIVAFILTIMILSNNTVSGVVTNLSDCNTTYKLAQWIANNQSNFRNTAVNNIFALNSQNNEAGLSSANEPETSASMVDIYYNTCLCMFHDQADNNGDGYKVKLTNIIDIESPTKMTVYKFNSSGSSSSRTLDFSTESSARSIYNTMKNNSIIDSSVSFDHNSMKRDITAFAYLTYKSSSRGATASSSNQYEVYKNAVQYYWKQPGGTIAIRKYAKASGLLDDYFYQGQNENDEVNSGAKEQREEAETVADGILTTPSLNIANTTKQPVVEYKNGNAYIGPLKVTYSGGTPTIKIGSTTVNWTSSIGGTVQTGTITSNSEFYAVIDEDKVKNSSNITVSVTLSYKQYKSRIVLATNKANTGQSLMFYSGAETSGSLPAETWTVPNRPKLTLVKQNNGTAVSGVVFKVYEVNPNGSLGTHIGTLTSSTSTTATSNKIYLDEGKEYALVETTNDKYGYKHLSISDATITENKGTIISKSGSTVKFKITDDATITIKNTPKFGDLTIHKVDANDSSKNLAGVKFVIYQGNKYLKLTNNWGQKKDITGTATINVKNEASATEYKAEFVDNISSASVFTTDSNGKIEIKNLEVWMNSSTKYEYWVIEKENNLYGYKGMLMENVTVNGTATTPDTSKPGVKFTFGDSTSTSNVTISIEIGNPQKLAEIKLHKTGANSEGLADVKFAIGHNGKGYIKLNSLSQIEVPDDGSGIDISSYTISYVSSATSATQFITNSNGELYIKNVEVYSAKGTKYTYLVRETENPHYGYEKMLMSDADITITGGTLSGTVNTSTEEVAFTINDNLATVDLSMRNTRQIGQIIINKTDESGSKKLEGVTFVVLRNSQFIVLKDKNGNTVETVNEPVTIGEDNIAGDGTYSISTTTNIDNATKFVTNSDGQIIINEVKIYDNNGNKYIYGVREISNDNYGYKNMGITTNDYSITGGTKSGTVSTTNRQMNFTINDNTGDAAAVAVNVTRKNKEELFNLNIHKVGTGSENLPDVEFVVLQNGKYVQLIDSSNQVKKSIKGTATINKDNKATGSEYSIAFTDNIDDATIFITGDDGKAVIKNLERYSAPGEKFEYAVREISNTNYGYKNMATESTDLSVTGGTQVGDVDVENRQINFIPNNNVATITMTRNNTEELFDLVVNKKGEDGLVLADVQFVILQNGKYAKLTDSANRHKTSVKGTVIINEDNIATGSQYSISFVDSIENATIFMTGSDGILTVRNLEIYSAPETKFTYIIRENANNNYGYKNMLIDADSLTVTGGSDVTTDIENKQIQFQPTNRTVNVEIQMKNNQQLLNLNINKKGDNNKNLAGVQFLILQDGKYIQLKDANNAIVGSITGTVTINQNNIASGSEYSITSTTNKDAATIFITDLNGQITINNLEIYSAPETEFNYEVCEIYNNNYGYKNMAVSQINLTSSGGNINVYKYPEERKAKFYVTTTAKTVNVTLTMKNDEQLFNLNIHKVGENNLNLVGVKFLLLQDGKYVQMNDGNGVKKEVNGTVTINKDNKVNGTECKITVTDDINAATTFITGNDGKVIVNNLEEYSALETKFTYTVREIENTNYGYKNMAVTSGNLRVTGGTETSRDNTSNREISFIPNNDVVNITVDMKNNEELFDLNIHKVGDNGKNLSGVKFIILQDGKYIQLSDTRGRVSEVIGSATINKANKASGTEYSISVTSDVSAATIFVTGEDGKVLINNMEIYSGVGTKYEYTVREVGNDSYGYKNMAVSAINFTNITGGSVTATNNMNNKEVKFTVNNTENNNVDITLQMKNDEQLFNLKIHKTGDNRSLSNVRFLILQNGKYVQINNTAGRIAEITGTVTINKDNVAQGSECNISFTEDESLATTFITDSNGQVLINNVEIYSGVNTKYTYSVREIYNENYGFKGTLMKSSDVSLNGATIVGQVDTTNRQVDFTINDSSIGREMQVNISNTPHYGNLEIIKVDKDNNNKKLPDVRFRLQIDNQYVQLIRNGDRVDVATGTSTISRTGEETTAGYGIRYVDNKEDATLFATDANGRILIENLEVYSGIAEDKVTQIKYTYAFFEEYNENYAYTIDTSNIEGQEVQLESASTKTMGNGSVTNEQFLGDLKIQKVDRYYTNIYKMEDIQFMLKIVRNGREQYVSVKDSSGQIIPSIKGTTTIDSDKIANSDEYYADNKEDATIFITDENGQILIENLEVYDRLSENNDKYTYKLIEIYNPYYGYEEIDPNNPPTYTTTLTPDKVTEFDTGLDGLEIGQIPNEQILMKISGFVWIEQPDPTKSGAYDCIYTDVDNTPDIKLTDLYLTDANGKVTGKNTSAQVPVEVKLRDKTTGNFIRTQPDEFNTENGEYTFIDIEIEKLANYEVVFVYDGFYYVTITENIEDANGSKVKDTAGARNQLNQKFGSVEPGGVVNSGGTVAYTTSDTNGEASGGGVSTVAGISFDTTISADTTEAGYFIDQRFDALKKSVNSPVEGLDNINMGLVLREQPKIAINSDIDSALVQVNGYEYTYKYAGRQQHYTNENGDPIGVQFEQESATRYTQTVYASDVELWKQATTKDKMNVFIIYRIRLYNQSSTLTSVINQITNYFDGDYTLIDMGYTLGENCQIANKIANYGAIRENVSVEYGEGVTQRADKTYNSVNIPINLTLTKGESKALYIKFQVNDKGKDGLLNGESTFHNATEVMSYSTYYGETTNFATYIDETQKNITTDTTAAGEKYAGIDKSSQPGNIKLKLINFSEEDTTTPVLDTTSYEDDETSAPSLLLIPTEERKISGTVWEDASSTNADNERVSNGIFDSGENTVDGVTVELYNINADGTIGDIAVYSDGSTQAKTTTTNGEYTLGYYDSANNKHIGILPGRYVIKYVYTNDSKVGGTRNIDVDDYKSTIIPSGANARGPFEAIDSNNSYSERWYIGGNGNRNSDARDDINLRPEYENGTYKYLTVTNGTYETYNLTQMDAYTPNMEIGVEFTENDEEYLEENNTTSEQENLTIETFENIDFGIVERPHVDMTVEKKITSLEVVSQTGSSIIPKGDPSDINTRMQYVKTGLDGVVSAEVESRLLQGARLNIEYTIKVNNYSEKNYAETGYYYYGTNKTTDVTPKATKLVDYLDNSMSLDPDHATENSAWTTKEVTELYSNGLISTEVKNALDVQNDISILTTDSPEVTSMEIYATRYLAVTDSISEVNRAEIIELTGTRIIHHEDEATGVIEEAIPGNYVPSETSLREPEPDEDRVDLLVTPPTGITENPVANYTTNPVYIAAIVGTFTILIVGIIIIKKKVIK